MNAEEKTADLNETRLHSMDGLRATMMFLGLVLHCAASYQHSEAGLSAWPFRDQQTAPIFSFMVSFIHAWRMPIFMFIGGFFGALLVEKRGAGKFVTNRIARLGIPLVLFLPILLPLSVSGFIFANTSKIVGIQQAWGILLKTPIQNFFPPITIHMWFLYYLLIYSFLGYLLLGLTRFIPHSWKPSVFISRILALPGSSIILSLPIAWALMDLTIPGVLETGVSWIPELTSFMTYGFLYLCGWSLWHRRDLIQKVATLPRIAINLASLPILFFWWLHAAFEGAVTTDVGRFLTAFLTAWIIWLSIWGFIGLFQKMMSYEIPAVRYFVDASYWIYIFHLPFTIWTPGFIAQSDWGSGPKFFISLTVTTLMGLITYDLFVRNTIIGKLLNGREWPRALHKALRNRPLNT